MISGMIRDDTQRVLHQQQSLRTLEHFYRDLISQIDSSNKH